MNFSDFTEKAYAELLEKARVYYSFQAFSLELQETPVALWRHDLDISVHRALKLAKIEASMGIRSTYFLHIHNEFYNVLEAEISDLIFEIKELGHYIGLHFDPSYYKDNLQDLNDLERCLDLEIGFLNATFDVDIKVFSFHNPDIGDWINIHENKIGKYISTYGGFFRENFQYCSDSNGYWRYTPMSDFLDIRHKHIQVLTHPAWWTPEAISPYQRIQRATNGRAEKRLKVYESFFEKHKDRVNVK